MGKALVGSRKRKQLIRKQEGQDSVSRNPRQSQSCTLNQKESGKTFST